MYYNVFKHSVETKTWLFHIGINISFLWPSSKDGFNVINRVVQSEFDINKSHISHKWNNIMIILKDLQDIYKMGYLGKMW